MSNPSKIKALSGEELDMKMSVEYVSFSAHCDCLQTTEFIDILQPEHIVLVHGEASMMARLKTSLIQQFKGSKVYSPRNCETVEITFSRPAKIAKVLGNAVKPFVNGQRLSGILVEKDYNFSILSGEDVSSFTSLTSSFILQSQRRITLFFLFCHILFVLSFIPSPSPPFFRSFPLS